MSKKSKLILATAVFGAALFGASCGGGGDGGGVTAAAPTPPPAPPTPPGPTVEGRVLALLNPVTVGAGAINPVVECRLMSNNRAECGNDLNPNADVELHYVYEFENGNVVLRDSDNRLYFFNGTRVERLTSFRRLDGTTGSDSGGITLPSSPTYHATPNFLIVIDNSGSTRHLRVITSSGKVISDSGSSDYTANTSCEVVSKGTTTYRLNVDGTATNVTDTTPDEVLVSAGDRFLVRRGDDIFLSSDRCSTSGAVRVATISNVDDAKMVRVGNNFYIAVRYTDDNNNPRLNYYEVSGNTARPLMTNINLHASPTEYSYALDGMGRLYAITANNTVRVYNIDGTELSPSAGLTITGVAGLLGLANRALAKDGSNVHEITITGSRASASNRGGTLHGVVDNCTNTTNTISVNGAGTNFIRCAHNNGLSILTYDSGSGVYFTATRSITGGVSEVKWATDKVLVRSGTTIIHLCTTRVGATSISCDETDLPALDPTDFGSYLKFNGDNVFYRVGTSLRVGDIFGTRTTLPITVAQSPAPQPSGGNASFDLRRFAFSFQPAGASCATQILYLSSPTASPKTYTIVQPSNACVRRILKVY